MSIKVPRGFRITLNSRSHPSSRMRFSWAHELGHIYIAQNTNAQLASLQHNDRQLERRCHELAAEFLMPFDLFCEDVSLRPVSLRTALELAQIYETSVTAAAIRYVKLSPAPLALVRWDRSKGVGRPLRLRWQINSAHKGPGVNCRWTSNPVGSPSFLGAQEAFGSRDVFESAERIFTTPSSQVTPYTSYQRYRVESRGLGTRQMRFVLSLVHLQALDR